MESQPTTDPPQNEPAASGVPSDVQPMGPVDITVSLQPDDLQWAQALAEREGRSLSGVVAEALREQRRAEAWAEVETWLREANPEPTAE